MSAPVARRQHATFELQVKFQYHVLDRAYDTHKKNNLEIIWHPIDRPVELIISFLF